MSGPAFDATTATERSLDGALHEGLLVSVLDVGEMPTGAAILKMRESVPAKTREAMLAVLFPEHGYVGPERHDEPEPCGCSGWLLTPDRLRQHASCLDCGARFYLKSRNLRPVDDNGRERRVL